MNDEDNFTRFRIHIHDDLMDQRSHDAFSQRLAPTLRVLIDAPFDLVDALQGLIPAPLQFVGHQPIFGIRRIVLLLRPLRRVARRFQVALPRVQHFVPLTRSSFARDHCGVDGGGLHNAQDFSLAIVASTNNPPNEMQRGSPLSSALRWQA
jgi:hypothetical protein